MNTKETTKGIYSIDLIADISHKIINIYAYSHKLHYF